MAEWGKKVARDFVKKVYNLLDIFSEYPKLGLIENNEKEIRGFVLIRQISIFYWIKVYTIILLDFFDNEKPGKEEIIIF